MASVSYNLISRVYHLIHIILPPPPEEDLEYRVGMYLKRLFIKFDLHSKLTITATEYSNMTIKYKLIL